MNWESAAAADPAGSSGTINIVAKWKTWGGSSMIDGITVGVYNITGQVPVAPPPATYYNMTRFVLDHDTPVEAILYRVSIAWINFHAHSWYNINDNLAYAQVRFYENGTLFAGGQLLGGDVTSGTGSGNTPSQIVPLHNNITFSTVEGQMDEIAVQYNFTNIASRVWWETVLVSNMTASTTNMTIAEADDLPFSAFFNGAMIPQVRM